MAVRKDQPDVDEIDALFQLPLSDFTAARNALVTTLSKAGRDEGRLDEPGLDRPRALCFRCFRIELTRRQQVAARLARGWNGKQVDLPLPDVLDDVNRRRRRAQIAARHALGI